jgi:hypothetical protein
VREPGTRRASCIHAGNGGVFWIQAASVSVLQQRNGVGIKCVGLAATSPELIATTVKG